MKLQFTNGYRPHFDQISRILNFILSRKDQSRVSRKEIVKNLGIPNKQVENLTSMMTGFGLILPRVTTLTPFGKKVITMDPYFEKLDTLWMIHYIVSSNPKWVVWHRIINIAFPAQDEFEVDQVSNDYFDDIAILYSEKTISEKLPKEVGAVFSAYTRSELSYLRLMVVEETGKFIKANPVDISDQSFLFMIIHYRDEYSPGSSAINVRDICYGDNSPGRVLNSPEFQVRSLLENLHNTSFIRLEKMANLDQVRISDQLTQNKVLESVYGR